MNLVLTGYRYDWCLLAAMVAMMHRTNATMNATRLIKPNVMKDRIQPATCTMLYRIEKLSASVVTSLSYGLRSLYIR